jgi:hypothetical protein
MPYTRRPFPKPEPQPPKPPASTSAINKYKKALAAWRVERDDWEDSERTYAEGVTAREALQQLSAPEVDDEEEEEEEEKPAKRGSRNRSGTAVPSGKALGKQRAVSDAPTEVSRKRSRDASGHESGEEDVGEAPSKRLSKAGSGSVGPSGQEKMEARGPQVEAQVRGQSERVRCES